MGIPRFMGYLKREHFTHEINIADDVRLWKRQHSGESPVILIDLLNLTYRLAKNDIKAVCGGQHKNTLEEWAQLLRTLKATGCTLEFFSDLNTLESKQDEWMKRRNDDFKIYATLYQSITRGCLDQFFRVNCLKSLNPTLYEMAKIAQEYGQLHYSVKHENDLELAKYAKTKNALAIISDDMDFMIFDGPWKLWSGEQLIRETLTTIEYDRDGFRRRFSLHMHHMALFATFMGNDTTKNRSNELRTSVGLINIRRLEDLVPAIANFVRSKIGDVPFDNIANMFPNIEEEFLELIRSSLNSYDITFMPADENPFEKRLRVENSTVYRSYMALISPVEGIPIPYYDLDDADIENIHSNLPHLIKEWSMRKKGFLTYHNKEKSEHFTILAKLDSSTPFTAYEEKPIYPNFVVPPLDDIYIVDVVSSKTKWNIFKWIMSLSDDALTKIRKLPKEFRLICATLYALVENHQICVKEADAILYSEHKIQNDRIMGPPKSLKSRHVRAAHIYATIAFFHVRENFIISGLLSEIEDFIKFDGVDFQNVMNEFDKMNDTQRQERMHSIRENRIYADIN